MTNQQQTDRPPSRVPQFWCLVLDVFGEKSVEEAGGGGVAVHVSDTGSALT